MRELVCLVLEDDGWRVRAVASGAEALETAAGEESVGLLVADTGALAGVGAELAHRLRARCPDLVVLYMSGRACLEDLCRETDGQAEAFLPKPFPIEVLAETARRLVERQEAAG